MKLNDYYNESQSNSKTNNIITSNDKVDESARIIGKNLELSKKSSAKNKEKIAAIKQDSDAKKLRLKQKKDEITEKHKIITENFNSQISNLDQEFEIVDQDEKKQKEIVDKKHDLNKDRRYEENLLATNTIIN